MDIRKKINAKIKLFEVMGKLNNLSITEKFSMDESMYATLMTGVEALKNGELLRERGGRSEVKSQTTDEGVYVEIDGEDSEGNQYGFKFNLQVEEGIDDDVVHVSSVDVVEFFFDSSDDSEALRLGENDLIEFNKQKNVDYYDIITKYVDLDLESDVTKQKR